MAHIMMTIAVEDYDKWRKVFDSTAPARAEAGSVKGHILRHAADPSRITILGHWDDGEKMKAYLESPALSETLKAAGVIGSPEIVLLFSEEKYVD